MNRDFRLEDADTPARLAELAALADVIWHEHYGPIIGQAQVEYMLARGYSPAALSAEQAAGTRFTLAIANGQAIGYAGLGPPLPDRPERAWLDKLYVAAAARGQGVGRALVVRAADEARTRWSADALALRVNRHNANSIAAYQAMGFFIEGTDVKDIGAGFVMDDYLMAATIVDLMANSVVD